MSSNQVYFNGINGLTGRYGLAPTTVEDLSQRIETLYEYAQEGKRNRDGERAQLEELLQREDADKIVALVRLLAESNVEDVPRNAAWHRDWVQRLAKVVAALLPGDEYREPARMKELERKLSVDTVEKTVQIVALLASTRAGTRERARKLQALLLRDPYQEPEYDGFRRQLARDFQARLDKARQELQRASGAEDLQEVTAQRAWLGIFVRELRTIPLDALNPTLVRKVSAAPLLIQALDGLARAGVPPSRELEGLRREMSLQPRDVPWNNLVDELSRWLDALLTAQNDSIPWERLLGMLDNWLELILRSTGLTVRGVKEGIDSTDIAQAGWGIIFPWEDPSSPGKVPVDTIREALAPLLQLRESQAGSYFRVYEKGEGYRPDETAKEFLERHGASTYNPADPEKVPYYLLLVGSPEQIPFHFQYQLDVQYGVGRIDFDSVEAYDSYARSVVAAETGSVKLAPVAAFFGVSNRDDRATGQTADHLVKPLSEHVEQRFGIEWQIATIMKEQAEKARLMRLMGGEETPAFLFAACHGVEFPPDDPQKRQVRHQGALLCQDWPGPESGQGEIPPDQYLSADDLADDANLLGLIGFFFACYSAGTPLFDEYYEREFRQSGRTIADQPFIAALPKAMLNRPKGGALAVVGHVERAWGTSYLGPRQSEQIAHFESVVEHLLKGHPIGSAMEYFNGRYAALSSELTYALQPAFDRRPPDPYELAELWTANNDARGYIVIGDPAVRLPVARSGEVATGRHDLQS